MKLTLFLFLLSTLTSACVSVNFGGGKVNRSEAYDFQNPPYPFRSEAGPGDSGSVDHLWRNPINANTISVFSDCTQSGRSSLTAVQKGILGGVSQLEVLSSERMTFNNREAIRSVVSGKVEGVDTQIEMLLFEKNACVYALSYLALKSNFSADQSAFKEFIKGFRVP